MEGNSNAKIEEITRTERINENVDIGLINKDKEMVIEEFEKALNILKGIQIKNEDDLVNIKKPLNDLKSYLKFIPNGPLFNNVFPTEIKEYILSYLCDSNAFVATSVCQEWKRILENRFKGKEVNIGDDCSKCEDVDNECAKPVDMLKTAAAHELDVHLVICKPITEVDSKFIADGLTSVSRFTITNPYTSYETDYVPILSDEQLEHLFIKMEKEDKIMEEINLVHLELNDLNQERLANCLVNKTKTVTLDQFDPMYNMLDFKTFMSKIQHDSANLKLTNLTMHDIHLDQIDGFSDSNAADALCKVENVNLTGWSGFMHDNPVMERLAENILQRPIRIKTLIIDSEVCSDFEEFCDFGSFISPEDLTALYNKMTTLQLGGIFTSEQKEAIRSLPDVEISFIQTRDYDDFFLLIKKGSSEMFG